MSRFAADLGLAPPVHPQASQRNHPEEGTPMKSTLLALSLMAVLLGLTACAKYPVVVGSGMAAPSPTAAAPSQR